MKYHVIEGPFLKFGSINHSLSLSLPSLGQYLMQLRQTGLETDPLVCYPQLSRLLVFHHAQLVWFGFKIIPPITTKLLHHLLWIQFIPSMK